MKFSGSDLSKDIMVRASFIHLFDGHTSDIKHTESNIQKPSGYLLFNMHHIASDGWSIEVLTKEFFSLYSAYMEGKPNPLPELEIQYADYAHWQREWLQGEVLNTQLNYWQQQLADAPLMHSLQLDSPRPEVKQHDQQQPARSRRVNSAARFYRIVRPG